MLADELRDLMKGIGVSTGLPSSFVTVLAELYFEPEEISLDELAERTGYSLGSISMKIKMLHQMGFVSRRKHPGTNKLFLYMEKDIVGHTVRNWIEVKQRSIRQLKLQLPKLIKKYLKSKLSKKEKAQFGIAKDLFDQATKMEKAISHLEQEIF